MPKKSIVPMSILLVTLLSGCAHPLMRGTVAMKVNEQEAHVCVNKDEVKVGEKVAVYKNSCARTGERSAGSGICQKVRLGEGTVTEILNDHYSVVKFDSGVEFSEGSFIESLK